MNKIVEIKELQYPHLGELRYFICIEVMKMQGMGYEVEIQYSAIDKYDYTALVIARQPNK